MGKTARGHFRHTLGERAGETLQGVPHYRGDPRIGGSVVLIETAAQNEMGQFAKTAIELDVELCWRRSTAARSSRVLVEWG